MISDNENLQALINIINTRQVHTYKDFVDIVLKDFTWRSELFSLAVEYSSFFVFYIPPKQEQPKEKKRTFCPSVEEMKQELGRNK